MGDTTRTLVRRALRSPAGGPVRLAHRGATAALVTYAQLADRRRHGLPGPDERAEVAGRVTVAAKTFERPAVDLDAFQLALHSNRRRRCLRLGGRRLREQCIVGEYRERKRNREARCGAQHT